MGTHKKIEEGNLIPQYNEILNSTCPSMKKRGKNINLSKWKGNETLSSTGFYKNITIISFL